MSSEHPLLAKFSQVAAPMPRGLFSQTDLSSSRLLVREPHLPLEPPVTIPILPSSTRYPLPPTRLVDAVRLCSGRDIIACARNETSSCTKQQ